MTVLRRLSGPAAGASVRLWCGAAALGIGAGIAAYSNGAAPWLAILSGVATILGAVAAPNRRA